MYKKWLLILMLFFVFLGTVVLAETDCGNDIDCLQRQVNELNNSLQMSVAATKPLESEINKLSNRIKSIQAQVDGAVKKQKETEIEIKKRGEKVSAQYMVLSVKLREMYKRLRSRPLWANLVASKGLGEIRREIAYRQDSNDKDRQIIVSLVGEISSLEIDKKKLEEQKIQLSPN
jgi:peptidoglycan hydrolase CwlO-like protein